MEFWLTDYILFKGADSKSEKFNRFIDSTDASGK